MAIAYVVFVIVGIGMLIWSAIQIIHTIYEIAELRMVERTQSMTRFSISRPDDVMIPLDPAETIVSRYVGRAIRAFFYFELLPMNVSLLSQWVMVLFPWFALCFILYGSMVMVGCEPINEECNMVSDVYLLTTSLGMNFITSGLLFTAHIVIVGLWNTAFQSADAPSIGISLWDRTPVWLRIAVLGTNAIHFLIIIGANVAQYYLNLLWPDTIVLLTFTTSTSGFLLILIACIVRIIPILPVNHRNVIMMFLFLGALILFGMIGFQILQAIRERDMETPFAPQRWPIFPSILDIMTIVAIMVLSWQAWRPLRYGPCAR